jgi:hypothetical protein
MFNILNMKINFSSKFYELAITYPQLNSRYGSCILAVGGCELNLPDY